MEQLGGKPGDRKFRANRFAESPASNTPPLEVLLLGGGWRNCLGCLRLTAEQCLGDGQTSSPCSLKICAFRRAAGPAPPPAVVGHLRAHRPRPCWQLCGFPDFRCLHAMGNGREGRGGHRGRRAPASCRLPRPRPQLPVGSGPGVTSAPACRLPHSGPTIRRPPENQCWLSASPPGPSMRFGRLVPCLAANFSILIFPIAGKGPHCPPCCPSQNQASLLMQSCLVQPPSAPAGQSQRLLGWPWA